MLHNLNRMTPRRLLAIELALALEILYPNTPGNPRRHELVANEFEPNNH
jgi:hypothetical protein